MSRVENSRAGKREILKSKFLVINCNYLETMVREKRNKLLFVYLKGWEVMNEELHWGGLWAT